MTHSFPTRRSSDLIVNRVFTPSQEEIDFWGEIVALQEEHDDDVKIDGKWYVRNKLLWGRLRLTLAAHFGVHPNPDNRVMRSEEHTSELQSLMRISYAVFCLNKNMTSYNIRT